MILIDNAKFFRKENKDAKIKIIKVLNIVISEIICCYNDVISIILFGSLARGEGVWKKEEKIRIISDLDILIITKRGRILTEKLKHTVIEIERKEGIDIDLKFVRYKMLKKLSKDTHNFDRMKGITIWGEDVTSDFPEFKDKDIGLKDIIFSFFNNVILTIENFPIRGGIENLDAKKWLSYEASKTMLICTRIISIRFCSYHPSLLKMAEFSKKKCEELAIPNKDAFLEDLNRATDFIFEDINKSYLGDAFSYWLRSREHLIKLFQLCIEKNLIYYDFDDDKMYESQLSFLYKEEYKIDLNIFLYNFFKLLVLRKNPKFPNSKEQYAVNCRMASLMLYLAINKKGLKEDYIVRANNYLSMVCHIPKMEGKDIKEKWLFMKDELKELHDTGIF